jgi:hypothetical protein
MFIDGRMVEQATSDDCVTPSELGWFATRQPGLLRFLEDRLGAGTEPMGIAVDLCWRIVTAFEHHGGAPIPRLKTIALEVAEEEVVKESRGRLQLANGCAHRQPELCSWLAERLNSLPHPLDRDAFDDLVLATFACISATDHCFEALMRGDRAIMS